jgi:hypothetical protein
MLPLQTGSVAAQPSEHRFKEAPQPGRAPKDPATNAESELYADFSLLLAQAIDYEPFPVKPGKRGKPKHTDNRGRK